MNKHLSKAASYRGPTDHVAARIAAPRPRNSLIGALAYWLALCATAPAIADGSVDFNDSSSKAENATADVLDSSQQVTICVWARADTNGENGVGHILTLPEDDDDASLLLRHAGTADELQVFKRPGSTGTNGRWRFTANDGVWDAVCVRYDFSDDNEPTARVNFANATVTENIGPDEVQDQPGTGYCVGNRSIQDRTWDGQIAHVQVFNDILTDEEVDKALRSPGSITSNLRLHLPMTDETDLQDLTANEFDATGTDLDEGATGPALGAPLLRRMTGGY